MNRIAIFASIAFVALLIFFIPKGVKLKGTDQGGGESSGNTLSEIQSAIKEVNMAKEWNSALHPKVEIMINGSLKFGKITDKQAETLKDELAAAYVQVLIKGVEDFFKGQAKYNLSEVCTDVSAFSKGQHKGPLALYQEACDNYFRFMGIKKDLDDMFEKMYDDSSFNSISQEISTLAAKKFLVNSPQVKNVKEDYEESLYDFNLAHKAYQRLKPGDSCAPFEKYRYYWEACPK